MLGLFITVTKRLNSPSNENGVCNGEIKCFYFYFLDILRKNDNFSKVLVKTQICMKLNFFTFLESWQFFHILTKNEKFISPQDKMINKSHSDIEHW
jgi:hypothetical protein